MFHDPRHCGSDDRVLPTTKNPYFLETYFATFRNPPYSECVKINEISKIHNVKKGILMKSLRVAFFGCLSGPDLIQSWELFSENKSDILRIERCLIEIKI